MGSVHVLTNTSQGDGGGLYIKDRDTNSTNFTFFADTLFHGNRSAGSGGGLSFSSPYTNALTVVNSQFLSNVANQSAALHAGANGGQVVNNCIVGNHTGALTYTGVQTMNATYNWWGAADGPSGDFPGSGDPAVGNLDTSSFQTTAPLGCPTLQSDIEAAAQVEPSSAAALLPGQPVTFTTVYTNNGPDVAHNVVVTQNVTSDYGLSASYTVTGSEIATGTSQSIERGFVVPQNITANHLITFTQIVTSPRDPTLNPTATITKLVTMPTASLAADSASVNESDDLQLQVQLDRVNPYADSVVTIQTSDGSATAGEDYTPINQQFVIPAGEPGTTIAIPITDDTVIEGDESFLITLSVGDGLFLGTPTTATITIFETLPDAALVMTKTVGIDTLSPACTGLTERTVPISTTVIYCYTVTNTGSEPLSNHSLIDDQLGAIPVNNTFVLEPGDSLTTTVTALLTISTTNVATWIAQIGQFTSAGLVDEVTVATTGAATVNISGPTDDQDGDTIPDNIESAGDPDGDNVPNFLDLDSDDDGRLDQAEVGPDPTHPLDSNNDGLPDFLDPNDPTALDPEAQPQQEPSLLMPFVTNQ
jgi:uncharacterized repeat protein (TIGR01451 family)